MNLPKPFRALLAVATVILTILYLVGAFVAWSWDPGTWDPFGRVLLAMFGLGGFVIAYVCALEAWD